MTDNPTTTPAIIPHDSDGLLYAATRNVLDGFRFATHDPAAVVSKIIAAIAAAKAEPEAKADAMGYLHSLPVLVAARGTFAAVNLADVSLPESGDNGYTVSMLGFKSLALPNPAGGDPVKKNGFWGLAIYPAHSVDSIRDTDTGAAWLAAIADKEAGLIAFRSVRITYGETTIADLTEGAMRMPLTVADFTDRARATGETFDTFNDLWPIFIAHLSQQPERAALVAALPKSKKDMLSAIRSTTFAEHKFPVLEKAGIIVKIAGAFARFVADMLAKAESDGQTLDYDAAHVTRWVENRDACDLLRAVTDDLDEAALAALATFGD